MSAPAAASTAVLRDAVEADLPAIRDIYNAAVRETTAIWNEAEVDLDNRRAWATARAALGYPVLVAAGPAGEVLGYGSFGDFRAFEGYRGTVEHSVYVAEGARGQGLGLRLLEALAARARASGKHVMVGAVEAGNAASRALHARAGFREAGVMREVGQKFGRWLDLVWVELVLDDRPAP